MRKKSAIKTIVNGVGFVIGGIKACRWQLDGGYMVLVGIKGNVKRQFTNF